MLPRIRKNRSDFPCAPVVYIARDLTVASMISRLRRNGHSLRNRKL